MKLERLLCGILFLGLVSCGGGGGGGSSSTSISSSTTSFTGGCSAVSFSQQSLSAAEVDQVIAQAVSVASTLGQSATVAVVDRVGNVLGVFQMSGGDYNVTITSNKGVSGGLESVSLDSKFAAISKAITGAYLSSSGMRFQREPLVLLFRITTYLKYLILLPAHFMASSLVNWGVAI